MHKPESIIEDMMLKIHGDFVNQTNHLIPARTVYNKDNLRYIGFCHPTGPMNE